MTKHERGFTDQKPRYATERDLNASWDGIKGGKTFRCYMCGYKYQLGDYWRWVYYPHPGINFTVCEKCDSGDNKDMIEKWTAVLKEYRERFWWARKGIY